MEDSPNNNSITFMPNFLPHSIFFEFFFWGAMVSRFQAICIGGSGPEAPMLASVSSKHS